MCQVETQAACQGIVVDRSISFDGVVCLGDAAGSVVGCADAGIPVVLFDFVSSTNGYTTTLNTTASASAYLVTVDPASCSGATRGCSMGGSGTNYGIPAGPDAVLAIGPVDGGCLSYTLAVTKK
jgi:hypothetical protein